MMKFLIMLAFSLGLLSLKAQDSTYNILYKETSGRSELAYFSVEVPGENALLVSALQFGGGTDRLVILKISMGGIILKEKFYEDPGFEFYPENIIVTSDSQYVVTGTKAIGGDGGFMLYKLNKNLDTVWTRLHQYGTGNEGTHKVIETADKGFLLVGFSQTFSNNDAQGIVLKTDSIGFKEWILVHGDSTHGEENWDVLELPDSSFLILSDRTYQQNDNIVLLKVSPQGQVIWERELNMIPGDIGTVLLPISSSTLLIGGIRWYSQTTSKGYIAKIDTSGNLLWEKEYGGNAWFSDGSKVNDNEYVFAGSIAGGITYQGKEDGYVVKVDSNGSLKWAKVINPLGLFEQNADEYFYGINALSDGGVLCTGFTFKGPFSGTQDAWILKLDSLGRCDTATCFPWLVGIENTLPPDGVQVRVFPNPASLSAVVSLSIPEPKEVKLELIDISGKRVYVLEPRFVTTGNHQFQIVTGHLPAGVYILKIAVGAEMITRKLVVQ